MRLAVQPDKSQSTLRIHFGRSTDHGTPQYISTVTGSYNSDQHAAAHQVLLEEVGFKTYLNCVNRKHDSRTRTDGGDFMRSAKAATGGLNLAEQLSAMMSSNTHIMAATAEGPSPNGVTAIAQMYTTTYTNHPGDGPIPLPSISEVWWVHHPGRDWHVDRWRMTFPGTGESDRDVQTFWEGNTAQIRVIREGIAYDNGYKQNVPFVFDSTADLESDSMARTIEVRGTDVSRLTVTLQTLDKGGPEQQEAHHQNLLQDLKDGKEMQVEAILLSSDLNSLGVSRWSDVTEPSREHIALFPSGSEQMLRLDERFRGAAEKNNGEANTSILIPNPVDIRITWSPSIVGNV